MINKTELIDYLDGKQDEMTAFLASIVNIDSDIESPEGNNEVAHIIGGKLDSMGFDVEYLEYPNICTHVKGIRKGSGDKHIMIIGHLDTIQPKGSATERPFTIKEGKAYGPGVLDMKGGITISLFALEGLLAQGWEDTSVTVFFCGDEEHAHPYTDAAELFAKEAIGKTAIFNMESQNMGDAVFYGRKGNTYLEMKTRGISVHSGSDIQKGANAVIELANKAVELNKLTDFERNISCNVGYFHGGVISNAVPEDALIKVDLRYTSKAECDEMLEKIENIAASNYVPKTTTEIINKKERFPALDKTDDNVALYEKAKAAAKEIGVDLKGYYGGSSSDSGWTAAANVPSICGCGSVGEFHHTPREYIFIDSLPKRAKILALTMQSL